uniref:Uncharacterized protein n=1 Tax=Cannabis sativa TaxID=3483 RepID=A0A803QD12_CANSA
MADNRKNVDTPHEESTHHPEKEPIGSRRPPNSKSTRSSRSRRTQPEGGRSTWTTRSRRTQNPGTWYEEPEMNISGAQPCQLIRMVPMILQGTFHS